MVLVSLKKNCIIASLRPHSHLAIWDRRQNYCNFVHDYELHSNAGNKQHAYLCSISLYWHLTYSVAICMVQSLLPKEELERLLGDKGRAMQIAAGQSQQNHSGAIKNDWHLCCVLSPLWNCGDSTCEPNLLIVNRGLRRVAGGISHCCLFLCRQVAHTV